MNTAKLLCQTSNHTIYDDGGVFADIFRGIVGKHGLRRDKYGHLFTTATHGTEAYFKQDRLILEYEGWSNEEIEEKQNRLKRNIAEERKSMATVTPIKKEERKPAAADIPIIKMWTATELMSTEFPEPVFLIPGLISEGLNLLTGPPKLGKSWLCLDISTTLSTGGKIFNSIDIEKNQVLYLALEDSPRRLQNRIIKQGSTPSEKCHFITEIPDSEVFIWLNNYMTQYPDTKLIIIDTLMKFLKISDSNDYTETVQAVSSLKKFADDNNISIIVVHHTKKAASDDYVNNVLGSTGITGTADTIITITRKRGQADAVLNITGRDVEEKELGLSFDKSNCKWSILGEMHDIAETRERQEILDLLKVSKRALKVSDIAILLGKGDSKEVKNNIRQLLFKLEKSGHVKNSARGEYISVSTNTENSIMNFSGGQ